MSYPDPNEATPMSLRKKVVLISMLIIGLSMAVYGLVAGPPGMTDQMRVERCASHQGALPAVGSIHYRLVDGLKVQVLSTRFVYSPNRYDALNNVDERFCAYSLMVRVEGHNKKSGMKLFEFGTEVE